MFLSLPPRVADLKRRIEILAAKEIAPAAEEVDRKAVWPEQAMRALQREGFMGLHVPGELGGLGEGMVALVALCEELGRTCSSTALCYGMHCVGTAVIAAKATAHQKENYLRPIAAGEHITTLCLSEPGSGSHFYLPDTELEREGDFFRVNGRKAFITNGGKADSYVANTRASDDHAAAGDFNCLILDRDQEGMEWQESWRGFGMRGNESRGLVMKDVRVPAANLLGEEGDQIWYIFEVVAPFFLMAMSGSYLGIAGAAIHAIIEHLESREYQHSGETLSEVSVLQSRLAEMWIEYERTRGLVYRAAAQGDLGDPGAVQLLLAAKAAIGETVVRVTNEAMSMCGGSAYSENGKLARLLRDARAAHVMSPTTEMLKVWLGRTLLGQPLL